MPASLTQEHPHCCCSPLSILEEAYLNLWHRLSQAFQESSRLTFMLTLIKHVASNPEQLLSFQLSCMKKLLLGYLGHNFQAK